MGPSRGECTVEHSQIFWAKRSQTVGVPNNEPTNGERATDNRQQGLGASERVRSIYKTLSSTVPQITCRGALTTLYLNVTVHVQ